MWAKSPKRVHHNRKNFSCTSFKDIHLLISEDHSPTKPTNKSPSIFHRVRLVNSLLRSWSTHLPKQLAITLPNSEDRVVIYYTSLRVVRSTSDDCRTVRSILRSFPVFIDERDVSMDHSYVSELHQIFSQTQTNNPKTTKNINPNPNLTLPKVFISGKFIGGAEEIRNLHESGELKKLLAGLPVVPRGGVGCEACDGVRFVMCEECSGSRRCYSEKAGFRTCSACNENGLVRCAFCEKVGFRTCSACNENGFVRCGYCDEGKKTPGEIPIVVIFCLFASMLSGICTLYYRYQEFYDHLI